jgi:protein-S-isoprenylcysteine O-methyltransferase Ste14
MAAPVPTPLLVMRPPVIALAAILLGLVLDWLMPLGLVAEIREGWRFALTMLAALTGAGLALAAVAAFRRADVSVGQGTPPRLVTGGVFAHTRHPMYLGILFGIFALALSFSSDWMLLTLVAAAFALHYRFALPEERLLEAEFGDEYRRYAAQVPRYGWRF